MSVEQALQGRWRLLFEKEPYFTEGRTFLEFRDDRLFGSDGLLSPVLVDGNTLSAQLADNVTLIANPDDAETGVAAFTLPSGIARVPALVRTSFDDGSDDLVEYATLVRQTN